MLASLALASLLMGPWAIQGIETKAAPAPSDWGDFEDYQFGQDDLSEASDEDQSGESTGAPTAESAPSAEPYSPSVSKHKDSGISGAFRLVGAFSRYDDAARSLGIEDDALLATVGRLLIDHRSQNFKIELNAFFELGRTPGAGGLGGAFATAATSLSAYRHEYLTVPFWSQDSMSGTVGLDRARVAWEHDALLIEAGRFPISHSVTSFFTPNDFFAPFAANAINRIYKPGVEAFRIGYAPSPLSTLEFVASPGFVDGYDPAWSHTALIARGSVVLAGWDLSVIGGKLAQRWVAGGGLQGTLGPMGLRAEGHVGIPDLDGKGRSGGDEDRKIHGRVAGGPNFNFDWHSSMLAFEYAYFSDGIEDVSDTVGLVTRLDQRYPDDLPYLGRHYLAASYNLQFIGVLSGGALGFVNVEDGSGLAGLSLNYSVANEADLVAGAFVPWGADVEADPLPELQSEFGTAPFSIYLESRVFF
jgi:hypothetical protein